MTKEGRLCNRASNDGWQDNFISVRRVCMFTIISRSLNSRKGAHHSSSINVHVPEKMITIHLTTIVTQGLAPTCIDNATINDDPSSQSNKASLNTIWNAFEVERPYIPNTEQHLQLPEILLGLSSYFFVLYTKANWSQTPKTIELTRSELKQFCNFGALLV